MSNLPANIEKVSTLRSLLATQAAAFKEVLPRHLTPERLARVACAAASRQPLLLRCTTVSMLGAVMQAAQLGLEPSGPLGDAYLVPYENRKKGVHECQLIPGYRGLIRLARQSGQVKMVEAHPVYQGESFELLRGSMRKLEHEPDWEADRSEKNIRLFYAIAWLAETVAGEGHGYQEDVMTKGEVDAIRRRSRASEKGPWASDYSEMGRKTVVKRLCKYLPLTTELATALDLDNRHEAGEPQDLPDLSGVGGADAEVEYQPPARGKATERTRDHLRRVREQQQSAAEPEPDEPPTEQREPGVDDENPEVRE